MSLHAIPEGSAGVAATLDVMVAMARRYKTSLDIRNLAESIVAGVPSKDYWGECRAVQHWVRDSIRYTQDIYDVETLKTPPELLASRQGDCDDQALLVAVLLLSIGYAMRFKAIGYGALGFYQHVFAEVKLGERWIAVETTEPVDFGWAPAAPESVMVRHI